MKQELITMSPLTLEELRLLSTSQNLFALEVERLRRATSTIQLQIFIGKDSTWKIPTDSPLVDDFTQTDLVR